MNAHFISRKHCPVCEKPDCTELLRHAFSSEPLSAYLVNFYAHQGQIDLQFLENQDFVLAECTQCGLIYQSEIPGDILMNKLYEEWLDPEVCFKLHEVGRGIEYFGRLSSEIVKIVKLLGRPPMELNFLDFSCGWGHWCRIAQSFGCDVHGTEFSLSREEYSRKKGIKVIDYDQIKNNRYDFINTEQVFEHVPNIRETLSYLVGSLNPGGVIKISVPNGYDIKHRLKIWDWKAPKGSSNSLNPVAPLEHVNCFKQSSLLALAESCGLVQWELSKPQIQTQQPGGVKESVKSILRPYWRKLKGDKQKPSIGSTCLFFQVKGDIKTS